MRKNRKNKRKINEVQNDEIKNDCSDDFCDCLQDASEMQKFVKDAEDL